MTQPIRILLYEDNRDLREGISYLLQATTGLELAAALPHVNNIRTDLLAHLPDVVLLDINMPGMSGLELLRRIREHAPTPPPFIVMITAYGDPEKYNEAMRLGANDFLNKPLDFNTLKQKLINMP